MKQDSSILTEISAIDTGSTCSTPSLLGAFTLAHPLVDACSLAVLIVGGMTWPRIIAYNAIAFALQLPFGLLADAKPGLVRPGFFCGTLLVAVATLLTVVGITSSGVLVAACIGNALFHLTAGKDVLETHGSHSAPIGLFISTGALGLLASRLGMARFPSLMLPFFLVMLLAVLAWTAIRLRSPALRSILRMTLPTPSPTRKVPFAAIAMAGLFVLVAWRSWAGMAAGYLSAGQGAGMILAGAAVTWAGKALGGILARPLGRLPLTLASVCGSAALAFFCSPSSAIAWLSLLFIAQLATGPVLSLMHDCACGRGGLAFGINCLALFLGSLA